MIDSPGICTSKTFDILGIGCIAVDEVLYVPHYPPSDAKIRVNRRIRRIGGLTAAALLAASRLGARCAYANVLGTDEPSAFALCELRAAGIDTRAIVHRAGAGPIHSTIIVDESTGTRNVFSDPSAYGAANPFDMSPEFIHGCRVMQVDHTVPHRQLPIARAARDAGVPVVGDFERVDSPEGEQLLALVNHLIIPLAFARKITGIEDPRNSAQALIGQHREVVVITAGHQGAWFASPGQSPVHVPALAVSVLDTTGCGDVFHGAYSFALAQGWDLIHRVRFASAAAALKATGNGLDAVVSSSAVKNLMDTCGIVEN